MSSSFQTLADIYADVRYIAGKDSNTLIDADLLRISNKYYLTIVRELVGLNQDLYGEISTTDLVADQKEYPLPVDATDAYSNNAPYSGGAIKVLRAEVSYDHTNWYQAKPIDLDNQNFALSSSTSVVNGNFDKSFPKYALWDRSLWLFPIPTSSDYVSTSNAGLRIFWVKRPAEMTATTDIPDLPKDFLSILSEGMLCDVYRKYGKIAESDRSRLNFNNMLQDMKRLELLSSEPLVMKSSNNIMDYE